MLLQVAGFVLCAPFEGPTLGRMLFYLTGVAHIRDYLAHMCFISAILAVLYAVTMRLLPDEQVELFMRRIEIPNIVAAATMLMCLVKSRALKQLPRQDDFFDGPSGDAWLRMYWSTYWAIVTYGLIYLIVLLLVLRTDPRSRRTAQLLIVAASIGIGAAIDGVADTLIGVYTDWIWGGLAVASALAAATAASSWRRRTAKRPRSDGDVQSQPPQPDPAL